MITRKEARELLDSTRLDRVKEDFEFHIEPVIRAGAVDGRDFVTISGAVVSVKMAAYIEELGFHVEMRYEEPDGPHPGYDYIYVEW